jgi:hypothetical protein
MAKVFVVKSKNETMKVVIKISSIILKRNAWRAVASSKCLFEVLKHQTRSPPFLACFQYTIFIVGIKAPAITCTKTATAIFATEK